MRERKYEEAEKFIRKAQKLYPTKKADGEPGIFIQSVQCTDARILIFAYFACECTRLLSLPTLICPKFLLVYIF